ncbi:MAG: ORF6N domain-containing protein [Patescibacteria group bacterium]
MNDSASPNSSLIPTERIEDKIYLIRGKKVMLDRDLAALYGVETRTLNQAVRRNFDRFPDDFMFKLTEIEAKDLISQFVMSNVNRGGHRHKPLAFTEQGVAMLSSVLNSQRAIMVNIQIIRTFTKLREMMAENSQLRLKIEALESNYDKKFRVVFEAIRQLLEEDNKPRPLIGFNVEQV